MVGFHNAGIQIAQFEFGLQLYAWEHYSVMMENDSSLLRSRSFHFLLIRDLPCFGFIYSVFGVQFVHNGQSVHSRQHTKTSFIRIHV